MKEFVEQNWGFVLQIPSHWSHTTGDGIFRFFPAPQEEESSGVKSAEAHLIIRPDWVFDIRNLDLLWQRHVGAAAGVIGAKKVGSAPLRIRDAQGFEAEVVLPKKENKRLWLAMLMQGPVLLNMMVEHHIKDRDWFEPEVSASIASLRFVEHVESLETGEAGLPLPEGYAHIDPREIIPDIDDASRWRGYTGPATAGALQAFYIRETRYSDWKIEGYTPFPSIESKLGFAKFQLRRGEVSCTLGIMPGEGEQGVYAPAAIILKLD